LRKRLQFEQSRLLGNGPGLRTFDGQALKAAGGPGRSKQEGNGNAEGKSVGDGALGTVIGLSLGSDGCIVGSLDGWLEGCILGRPEG
jgi:hypothetical protein